jgi:large-conductance mechanosensitive channel
LEKQVYRPIFGKVNVKKALIFVLIAVIVGLIFLSINTVTQNEDSQESTPDEPGIEEQDTQPQGRNLSVQIDEKMGFSTP